MISRSVQQVSIDLLNRRILGGINQFFQIKNVVLFNKAPVLSASSTETAP
jgi:hypothetical protein